MATAIQVATNFVAISKLPTKTYYQYDGLTSRRSYSELCTDGRSPVCFFVVGEYLSVVLSSKSSSALLHADITVSGSDAGLPKRRNYQVIDQVQAQYAQFFNPRAVYDGRKLMFSTKDIPSTPVRSFPCLCTTPILQ